MHLGLGSGMVFKNRSALGTTWGLHALPADSRPAHLSRSSARPGATTEQDKALLLRPGGQGLAVIIVSGPSAKAAQRVRTGRYTPAGSRSSATHNDTPRHADTRPISVHTEVDTDLRTGLPGGSPSGMGEIPWRDELDRPRRGNASIRVVILADLLPHNR